VSLVSLLSAGDNTERLGGKTQSFIGIELGGTMVQADIVGDFGEELNHKGTGLSFGLRLGAQNTQWRSMLFLDYFDSKGDNQNYERLGVQVDYFLVSSMLESSAFRPYIGLNGSYLNYESTDIDESGFGYGGEIGFVVAINQMIDLDLEYRYSVSSFDRMANVGSVVLGLHYVY